MMDVEETSASNLADTSFGSGGKGKSLVTSGNNQTAVTVALHPLLLMNMSEHWTRMRAQAPDAKPQHVIGVLMGIQEGRSIELKNSFELPYIVTDGLPCLDMEFYKTREEQYVEVFPNLSVLGWYSTADHTALDPNQMDVHVHNQICNVLDSPLFIKLDPQAPIADKVIPGELPVCVYESVIDAVAQQVRVQFVRVQYSLATEQAERIGVEHIATLSTDTNDQAAGASKQLLAMHGAVNMLHKRLLIVVEYLKAVHLGQLPRNEELVRDAAALCDRLPIAATQDFTHEYDQMSCDVTLICLLGSMTKASGRLNQLVSKLNVMSDRHGNIGVRRARALYM